MRGEPFGSGEEQVARDSLALQPSPIPFRERAALWEGTFEQPVRFSEPLVDRG